MGKTLKPFYKDIFQSIFMGLCFIQAELLAAQSAFSSDRENTVSMATSHLNPASILTKLIPQYYLSTKRMNNLT
jgi:hypothetical protein